MPEWVEKLKAMIKAHPAVAGGAALGGSVVIFFVIKNHQKAASSSSANTPAAESTPTSADMAAMHAMNGFDVASMAGLPYGYVSQNGPVDNYPQNSTSGTTPTPTPTPAPTPTTPTQTTTQQDPSPYEGLLGPHVAVDFSKRTYTSPTVKTPQHLPIPDSDSLVQGKQNRVWYVDQGIQHLLTEGEGPPVTNSGFPVGAPQNTPGAYGGGGFFLPVNQERKTIWDLLHVVGISLVDNDNANETGILNGY